MDMKILIVDDDPTMLFLHNSLIVKSGISSAPVTFLNGEEAYEYLYSRKDEACSYIILLDLNMPVMNGWQFLEKLEEQKLPCEIDVAVVTSSVDKADRERAKTYDNVVAYLTKPFFNLDEIKRIAKKHMPKADF